MPIRIKYTDLEFGDVWYIKNDPQQAEYILVGVVTLPGAKSKETATKFRLSYQGEIVEVYDFECSKEVDEEKKMLNSDNDEV